ncbi:MAG: YqgE/AlgH family protein [Pseudomonadota bacterium]
MTAEETDSGDEMGDEMGEGFLAGQILIAMPTMPDPRFKRSLVYLCSHSGDGAMGLMINREADGVCMADLFGKLSIPLPEEIGAEPIRVGGPVETGRGFVLHSDDYHADDASLRIEDGVSMTATLEVLHAIASGEGPKARFVALGYAGWGPGQLEMELRQNGWLACPADPDLLFGDAQDAKWERALAKLGISAALLAAGGSA